MRVTFVLPEGQISGAETVLLELVRARPKADLSVLCPPASPLAERLASEGLPIEPFTLSKHAESGSWTRLAGDLRRAALAVRDGLRRLDPDVVHVFLPLALKAAAPMARSMRRPVVLSVHDELTAAAIGRTRATVQRGLTLATVRDVITVSDHVRHSLLASGYPAGLVTTVHNGIDARRLQASPADRARVRAELGVPEDSVLFGAFGRLTPWKGQDVAIAALARLPAGPTASRLLVLGSPFHATDAGRDAALRHQAVTAGVGDRVHFVPSTPDVAPYYAAVDAVLVPSTKPDPFPTVALEAGAAGRSTVVTELGGAKEAVLDGVTGLVRSPQPGAFAEAMAQLLDPDVRAGMGAAARVRVERTFGPDEYARGVAAVWDRAVVSSTATVAAPA